MFRCFMSHLSAFLKIHLFIWCFTYNVTLSYMFMLFQNVDLEQNKRRYWDLILIFVLSVYVFSNHENLFSTVNYLLTHKTLWNTILRKFFFIELNSKCSFTSNSNSQKNMRILMEFKRGYKHKSSLWLNLPLPHETMMYG